MRAILRIPPAITSLMLLIGCSSAPAPPPVVRAAPGSSQPPAAAVAPAWDYHPRSAVGLRTRIDLEDGSWLFAGAAGERWRADPGKDTAEAASHVADEDLIAILRPSAGGFVFVGNKGSLYTAKEPLGPFTEIKRPEHKLERVTGRAEVLIGIRENGSVVRSSDGGRTFADTSFEGGRVFDMAVAGDGRTLLLSMPEQLWESSDGGATFKLSAAGSIGAREAGLDASGNPYVRGMLRSLIWPKGAATLQPLRGPVEAPELDLMTEPKPGPSGLALASGSAALDGTRYVEAIAPRKSGAPWSLAISRLIGRASMLIPIPGSGECGRMLVTVSGRQIVMGCLAAGRGNQPALMPPLKLIATDDDGVQFHAKATGLVVDDRKARLRLLPSGTLLLTSACRPAGRRLCQANAPVRATLRVTRDGLRLGELETPEAPTVAVQTSGVEVSPDAKRIYWAGRLAADRSISLLVSDDDGAKYKPVPLDLSRISLGGEQDRVMMESAQLDELGSDEQGNVSLTLTTSEGRLWIVFDAEGRAGSASLLPEGVPSMSAAGRKALSYGARDGILRVSQDGGGSWEELGRVAGQSQTDGTIACRWAGCAIGPSLSWQGWAKAPGGIVDPGRAPAKAGKRAWLTPIVCKASAPWKTIPSAERNVTAHDADRNGAVWSTIVREQNRSSVKFAVARSTPAPRVEMMQVFEPGKASAMALTLSSQAEGMAALRYPIERDSEGEIRYGRPLQNIEVGWVNLYDGGVKRARLAESGMLTPEDASGWRTGEEASATAEILSVSMAGIFVCPHNNCEGTDKLGVFIDRAGRARPISIPVWSPPLTMDGQQLSVRADMISVDGTDVPLGFVQPTLAIGRASKGADGFRFQAAGLLPQSAREHGYSAQYSWAFMEGPHQPALYVTLVHPTEPVGYARLLQFRRSDTGFSAQLPAPIQAEAGDPPRACTPADRKSTYRVIAPSSGGARHPVRIEHEGKPIWLFTDDAVMFGKAGEGCVSMLDTVGSGTRESGQMHALIDVSHPSTSWLFDTDQGENGQVLQWTTMQCEFDGTLVVPDTLKPEGTR